MRAFIPAWLDDEGLSQSEFRIYCHLCRRADNQTQIAWPSYKEMTKSTRMEKSTVRRAIEELERRELIEKAGKPFGGSCRYRILPRVSKPGQMDAPNSFTTETFGDAPIVPSLDRNSSISGSSIVSLEGQEGNPLKGIQLRESNRSEKASCDELSIEGSEFAKWFRSLLPENQQDRLPQNWLKNWRDVYDKLVRIDKRDPKQIREVSIWARNDSFWKLNFGSPGKLRKRNPDGVLYFDVFLGKMNQTTPMKKQTIVDTGNRTANYERI